MYRNHFDPWSCFQLSCGQLYPIEDINNSTYSQRF